jgi:hypothetical protein
MQRLSHRTYSGVGTLVVTPDLIWCLLKRSVS